MKKSPVAVMKERFESKEKLVEAVQALATPELWVDRVGVKGLERVSNAKLLRLHELLERAKKDFGSRAKLITAILELEKRTKDDGMKARLERYPLPRLLDLHTAAARRSKRAAAAAAKKKPAPAKKKQARSKKAQVKARAAAKK